MPRARRSGSSPRAAAPRTGGATSGGEATFHIADSKAHLYANVFGTLEAVNDSEKLDELWNAFAAAWFENGRDDAAVQLVKFTPREAEIWSGDGSVSFLYEIAKANLTGDTPDAGAHGRVVF